MILINESRDIFPYFHVCLMHFKNTFRTQKIMFQFITVDFIFCFFYCIFLQSCFYLYTIYHISNNLGTMLCKSVSISKSEAAAVTWGKSRGENWIEPHREAQAQGHLSSIPEPYQNPEAPQPTRSRVWRSLSKQDDGMPEGVWHVRK